MNPLEVFKKGNIIRLKITKESYREIKPGEIVIAQGCNSSGQGTVLTYDNRIVIGCSAPYWDEIYIFETNVKSS